MIESQVMPPFFDPRDGLWKRIDVRKPFPMDRLPMLLPLINQFPLRPALASWLTVMPSASYRDVPFYQGMLNFGSFSNSYEIEARSLAGWLPYSFSYQTLYELNGLLPSGDFLKSLTDSIVNFEESIDLKFFDHLKEKLQVSWGPEAILSAIRNLEAEDLIPQAIFSKTVPSSDGISLIITKSCPSGSYAPLDSTEAFVVARNAGTMLTSPRNVSFAHVEDDIVEMRVSKILGFVVDPRAFRYACLREQEVKS